MLACTRCGHWHTDAEKALQRRLSCTQVKQFWGRVKGEHRELYGHTAQIITDDAGSLICFNCQRKIVLDGSTAGSG
jgi:hypothetical protein